MATLLYLRDLSSTLGGAGQKALLARRGNSVITTTTTTVASGTSIQVTDTAGGQALTWFSEPLTQSITISGAILWNIRVRESGNNVNAGIRVLIERTTNVGSVVSTVANPTSLEASTSEAVQNNNITPTSTTFSVGERIKTTLFVINVGTMGSGTFNTYHNGSAASASGDSFVQFSENFVTDEIIEVGANEIAGGGIYG